MRKVVRNVLGVSISVVVASTVLPGSALTGASAVGTATISGHVTDGTVDLPDIDVTAYQLVAGTWTAVGAFTSTDVDGTYTIDGLDDGTYRVGFQDLAAADFAPEYYDDAATLATATNVATSTATPATAVDAVLAPASRIRGNVTGPDGPAAGVAVTAYELVGGAWQPADADPVSTGSNGSYDLGGLRAGTYRIGFRDTFGNLAVEFYDDAPTVDEAVGIVVDGDAPNVDAALVPGGHITGRVTNGAGAPLAATVVAYRRVGAAWKSVATTQAGLDGRYDVAQLPAGSYRVAFASGAIREYWNDKGAIDAAQDVAIAAGALTAAGRDAVLIAGEHDTLPAPAPAPAPQAPPAIKSVTNTKLPHVIGKALVGRTLRLSSGAWTPSTVGWKVRWLANGKAIKKATRTTLKVTRKQLGKKISARIVASARGYQSGTVTTRPTGRVR
jgi:5-hydroxyisourate hydrolase-like protein (transthyretin family)